MPDFVRDFRVARTYASSHHVSGTVIANLTALEAGLFAFEVVVPYEILSDIYAEV
jgi:hypothetical protein